MHNLTCVWLSSSPPSTFLPLHFISSSVCCHCLCAFLVHQVPAGVTAASPPLWLHCFFWLKLHFWGQGLCVFSLTVLGARSLVTVWKSLLETSRPSSLLGWLSVLHFIAPGFCKPVRPHQNMRRLDLTEGACQFPPEWRLHPCFSIACPVFLYEYALHDSFSSPEHLSLTEVLWWTSCVLELWCRLVSAPGFSI